MLVILLGEFKLDKFKKLLTILFGEIPGYMKLPKGSDFLFSKILLHSNSLISKAIFTLMQSKNYFLHFFIIKFFTF
jgi:hypothetical protein